MTIESADQIPRGHFGGGAYLTSDEGDSLRAILNRMKTVSSGYASFGMSANQTGPDPGDHIEWDSSSISGSLISLSTGVGQANGIVTLAADHAYRISFGLDVAIDSPEEAIFQAYDRTQSATLVTDGGSAPKLRCRSDEASGDTTGLNATCFVFSPDVVTEFDVRIASVSGGGTVDIITTFSWMMIDVLN